MLLEEPLSRRTDKVKAARNHHGLIRASGSGGSLQGARDGGFFDDGLPEGAAYFRQSPGGCRAAHTHTRGDDESCLREESLGHFLNVLVLHRAEHEHVPRLRLLEVSGKSLRPRGVVRAVEEEWRSSLQAFSWLWKNRRRLWAKRREIAEKVSARKATPSPPGRGRG